MCVITSKLWLLLRWLGPLICTALLCGVHDTNAAVLFTSSDCDTMANTTEGHCDCSYTTLEFSLIICNENNNNKNMHSNISLKSEPWIRINITSANDVDLICDSHVNVTKALERNYEQLPRLGTLRNPSMLTILNCLPIGQLLFLLQLTPKNMVRLKFDTPDVQMLQAADFGDTLKSTRNLELLSLIPQEQQQPWQLAPDLFKHTPTLNRLQIEFTIKELPTDIFKPLPSVTDLWLISNINVFPRAPLRFLSALRILRIARAQLQSLSNAEFENITSLRELYLHSVEIEVLPAQVFWPLRILRRLSLAHNRLRTLPATLLEQQVHLVYLDLSSNHLRTLHPQLFANTKALTSLQLQGNRLQYIDVTTFAPLRQLQTLNLYENQLYALEPLTFFQNGRLQTLSLHSNRLRMNATTSCIAFKQLHQLRNLNLAHNALDQVCPELGGPIAPLLLELNLDHNQLSHLDDTLFDAWRKSTTLVVIRLAHNPWQCDCSAEQLLLFIKSQRVIDGAESKCTDARLPRLVDLSFRYVCPPEIGVETQLVIIIVFLSGAALLVTTSALCYYKYRLELKIWLYAHQLCLCCVSETELDRDRKYDAFISYSHMDEQFVEHELVPGLEKGTPPFKVCIHVRDWIAGAYIAEQIVESVEQSRRTIIVLSQHFIESDWARMEFRTAHQCSLNEGRARIVLIIYGELTDTTQLDSELQAYLKMNTYLKWGDPWFWRKLRYAMPHQKGVTTKPKTRPNMTEVGSGSIELI